MPDLEDASNTLPKDGIFNGAYDDGEDVGVVANFNNMDNTIAVSPIPTLRIHKDHPKRQILGDPSSAVLTNKLQGSSELFVCMFSLSRRTQDYRLSQDKYVADILKKFDFCSIKIATTPIKSNKPLVKDEDGVKVSVTPKASHLHATFSDSDYAGASFSWTRNHQWLDVNSWFNFFGGQHWNVKSAVTFEGRISMNLRMDRSSPGKYNSSMVCYALSLNPTIYELLDKTVPWQTATVRTLANGTQQLVASIDSKELLYEALLEVNFKWQMLQDTLIYLMLEIYAGLANWGYEGSLWSRKAQHNQLNPITHLSYEAPLPEGNTLGSVEDSMQLKELMVLIPILMTRVTSLETKLKETKQTLRNVVLKLGEEPEDQGRRIQDIDDNPLVSLVIESMKEKSTDFVTPTKASGEVQEEEIIPTILEAAKNLSSWRRARSIAKKIDTGFDAEEEINTGREEINTGIEEVSLATYKTKEQVRQKEAGLEEAIKLQAHLDDETKTSKKQRFDDKDVPVIGEKVAESYWKKASKKEQKRKKQKARKGIKVDKSAQEDSETDKEESVEAMNHTPLTTKSDSMVNWKIFQQGQRSIYQIMRANGADIVYMSFGAMVNDFTREDLIELYRTMVDPPLNEDVIWSLPLQQKMVSWRYYDKCEVHCLTLEACTIYMLADRKYPLSKEACQVMLKMKLLDGKMNEVCYKLLKMIEKQAGIRK
ncbi:hypothetical protein Tco_1247628 [Tanacetum coccineum]